MCANWTEFRRFLTKGLCVIFSGLILMTDADGEYLREVLVTPLVKIFQNNSIIQMGSPSLLVLISWSWR